MKNVVFTDTARGAEFKPESILARYLALNESDLKTEFVQRKIIQKKIACPACRSKKYKNIFVKTGFNYVECENCGSVYLSPRPEDIDIRKHFLTSSSTRYWRGILMKNTAEKRREKIYSPRLQWIIETSDENIAGPKLIADFNSKNSDFSKELIKNKNFSKKIIANPYFEASDLKLQEPGSDEVTVVSWNDSNDVIEPNSVNIVTAFEVIDYASDVDSLMNSMNNILQENGLCFLTTISISGFDIQVLWDHAESIFPLDRINIFSYKGLYLFFERHGFELIEFSTPGMLDFNIIEETCRKHPEYEIPRFVKTMIDRGDEQLKKDFQNFLQVNKLSSFVRIVARKKGI